MNELFQYLPVSREELRARDWYYYDFLVVTGDAYVDHPSFGAAVIGRVLENAGYRVAILAQPDWRTAESFEAMGKPRYGVLIGAGNLDSMVAHYTAARKPRSEDFYSPGKRAGLRPDRATIVYANRAREAFGAEIPVIIGGLEASLRRFAHYDYWDDKVRRSILFDAKADLLVYGMGERATLQIAALLKKKTPVSQITNVRGTAYIAPADFENSDALALPSFESVSSDKRAYARAAKIQYEEHDAVRGRMLTQPCGGRTLVVNPPAVPLTEAELDAVAALPFTREPHPMYEPLGGVPAIEEVRFSIIHNRGCFGGCSFCSLAFHQGRAVTARSRDSVVEEAKRIIAHPDFKGYIHDVGGPTANFRHASCEKQKTAGMCPGKRCLTPEPCPNLDADHSDYLALLRRLRALPGVKKVFIRSGIRFDYMLREPEGEFFAELVRHHISGQLKVAPEHCVDAVLDQMGKPRIAVYENFVDRYTRLNQRYGKNQFLVPYLMSSHPGSTLQDAAALAEYLHDRGIRPEQVQDFYPTPGTLSTCMYYTGLDPYTLEPVFVAKTPKEKSLQRALLQWYRPEKRRLVREALKLAGREDLIGYGKKYLVPPEESRPPWKKRPGPGKGKT